MFTGLVQGCGVVRELRQGGDVARLTVDPRGWEPEGRGLRQGDSVCVSGVCLTVVRFDDADGGRTLGFDVVQETLDRTTLGKLASGSRVNLESAVTPATPLGGHFMQGHVDGTGRVVDVRDAPTDRRVTIRPDPLIHAATDKHPVQDPMDAIVPKGSIAVDGVSLTVASVGGHGFTVALIPVTLEATTMGTLSTGDTVNLELDIVSKTVVYWLSRQRRR